MHRPPPLVIGHATAAGEAPANTLAGVEACLRSGAAAMEIDVQLSADDIPVLMHDTTLDRTTNLAGPVRSFTAAQLAAADAGGGEPVPSLAYLLAVVAGRIAVFCELKSTPGEPDLDEALVAHTVATIEGQRATAWAGIHSFSPAIVEAAARQSPRLSTALISPPVDGPARERLLAGAVRRGAQAVSVHHSSADREFVLAARRRQLTVWVWTADEPDDWARLAGAGVDGIITNYPSRLAQFHQTID